mmetsp:Transcript_77767/g.210254  ORF Transcript_77767/g.210254 Transcript_77767/m.210254 type:complete len:131 (+) Transcript_77767:72-464(+)
MAEKREDAQEGEPPAKRACSMSADEVMATIKPKKMLCLRYTYIEGMLEKRGPYRAEHIKKAKELEDDGLVFMAGAFNEPCDGAIFFFNAERITKEEILAFAKADPYVVNGLVTKHDVCDYMAVVGTHIKE